MEKHVGWYFFVPNDLTLGDFYNNTAVFINEFIEVYKADFPCYFKVIVDGESRYYWFYLIDNNTISIKHNTPRSLPEFIAEKDIEKVLSLKIEEIILLPGSKILIPSGIHVNLPKNVFLNAENKSGIASKRGLVRAACLIDNDYQRTNSHKSFKSNLL